MTLGSNPSYDVIPCPWCGENMIDNVADGPTIHMRLHCRKRTWWRQLFYWLR